jgi:Leucine-rich repeat (LRR) protein
LPNLKHLELSDTPITDAGLKHLAKLSNLETLHLTGTSVTEAGVQRLQSQLPRCKVTW